MQRLRNLAPEALTWPHPGERQRLVWAAALELDAVPLQDHPQGLEFTGISSGGLFFSSLASSCWVQLCLLFFSNFWKLLDLFFNEQLPMR